MPHPSHIAPSVAQRGLRVAQAWPNRSARDRFGIYLKYHARASPPATGPIIHPHAARDGCRAATALLPYTRSDGRCAGIRRAAGGGTEPVPTVDAAALILERPADAESDGRIVLGVRQPGGGWALPSAPVDEAAQGAPADLGLQYLDCGNVIGALQVRPSDAIARPRWRDGPVRSRQAHVYYGRRMCARRAATRCRG